MIKQSIIGARIISCDIFDTVLKRNSIAEPNRVRLIARRSAAMLQAELGVTVDAHALWQARVDVQRYAYRALDMVHPTGEVRFASMIDGMAASLGLGSTEAEVLMRAELLVERTQLAPNRQLLTWLAQRAAEGMRIIAISDTWHSATNIMALLDAVAPGHPIAAVYTSADLDATKRSAHIFPKIIAKEGIPAEAFFHIGDDALADDCMPRKLGLQTYRINRPRLTILGRRFSSLLARVRLGMPHN